MPTDHESTIRAARAHSNRSIARRNLLGVADSLAENFCAIIGDGTFVPTRAAYLKLFKQGFDVPKTSLTYRAYPRPHRRLLRRHPSLRTRPLDRYRRQPPNRLHRHLLRHVATNPRRLEAPLRTLRHPNH